MPFAGGTSPDPFAGTSWTAGGLAGSIDRDGGGGTLADVHGWARYERLWLKALLARVQAKMFTDGGGGATG